MKNHLRGSPLFIHWLTALWVVSSRAAYAQPIAPPSLGAGMLPDWVGAIGAALIVGGILFSILSAIGDSLGRRLGRPVIEQVFKLLGTAAWIAVFILFLFVL